MGMSASQARLLNLQARQSNLEYQGQQINQERSILSQQATDLYNSLLDMDVPTPPSTQAFTTVQYSGLDGATSFSIGQVVPTGDTYTVELKYQKTGHYLEEKGSAAVEYVPEYISILLFADSTKAFSKEELYGNYAIQNGTANKIDEQNITTYFDKQTNGTYKAKTGVTIGQYGGPSNQTQGYKNPDFNKYEYYVAGQPCMDLSTAKTEKRFSDESYKNYIEAIKDSHPEYANKTNEEIEADFKVYFTTGDSGLQVPHFVSTTDLTSGMLSGNDNKFVASFDYVANGKYTSAIKETGCKLVFDNSGRITEIKIPTNRDASGNPTAYKTHTLEAATVTDNIAYQDAYAKYEYAKYEYDRKQEEVNAKTEVIQKQDRNLELKLQRLDNERTQIKTEIDAVDKVINDNIEATYKTFSG